MEPSNTPARKYNPYYLPEPEGCGKRTNCPYKAMPELLQAVDFENQSMMEFTDSYCSTCERKFKLVPPPPPSPFPVKPPIIQPEPKPWFRKYWWLIVLLIVLIAGLIYWFYPRTKFCEEGTVIAGRDTCENGVKYAVICDGKGGFAKGDSIGNCKPVPAVCANGTVVDKFCRGGNQYYKICDGKGGFIERLHQTKSPDCPQPAPTPPAPVLPVFKPGVPYVVNRNGRCTIEIYNEQGGFRSQGTLKPGDPRCNNALPAPSLPVKF